MHSWKERYRIAWTLQLLCGMAERGEIFFVMVVLDINPTNNFCRPLVDFVKSFGPKMCAGFGCVG